MRKVKAKTITEQEVNEFKRLAVVVDEIVKEIEGIKKKSNSLIKVLQSYSSLFADKV